MYLFDLNMSKIKSEAPAQKCSKRKVFLKILQNSLENTVRASRFYDEKSNIYVHILPGAGVCQCNLWSF